MLYIIRAIFSILTKKQPQRKKLWFFLSTLRISFVMLLYILISWLANRHVKDAKKAKFKILGKIPRGKFIELYHLSTKLTPSNRFPTCWGSPNEDKNHIRLCKRASRHCHRTSHRTHRNIQVFRKNQQLYHQPISRASSDRIHEHLRTLSWGLPRHWLVFPYSHQIESRCTNTFSRCVHSCRCLASPLRLNRRVLFHPHEQSRSDYHPCSRRPHHPTKHRLPILAGFSARSSNFLCRCFRHYFHQH